MKKSTKNVAFAVAGVALGALVFAGVSVFLNRNTDEMTLKSKDYSIYRLDDTTGKPDETDKSGISTISYYEIEDIKSITFNKDANKEVYINLYNKDKTFIQADELTGDWTDENAESATALGAVYFKVEIVDPEDDSISIFEKSELVSAAKVVISLETEEESK